MTIRPYKETDKEAVHDICLYCDGPENYSEDIKNFLFATYCDYYIEKEPFNCFVAADENDKAVGYIICAEDFDKFIKVFREEYFTRIPEEDTSERIFDKWVVDCDENAVSVKINHRIETPDKCFVKIRINIFCTMSITIYHNGNIFLL